MRSFLDWRAGVLVLVVAVVAAVVSLRGPIAQLPDYNEFADQRTILGVPNFWNVASNAPFAVIGVLGLALLWRERRRSREMPTTGGGLPLLTADRLCLAVFFIGVLWTAFGSGWYHLHPDNDRLVWDRIPMSVAFMGLVAAIIAERISGRVALWLLPPLLALGVVSVLHWHASEVRGESDLRFNGALQAMTAVFIGLCAALYPGRYLRWPVLLGCLVCYGLAKVFEFTDGATYRMLTVAGEPLVSGHTIKHVVAAAAPGWILVDLWRQAGRGR